MYERQRVREREKKNLLGALVQDAECSQSAVSQPKDAGPKLPYCESVPILHRYGTYISRYSRTSAAHISRRDDNS